MDCSFFRIEVASRVTRRSLRLAVTLLAALCILCATGYARQANPSDDSSIPAAGLLNPVDLIAILNAPSGEKPLILQVGSHVLFTEAHIPGAQYAGAARDASGLQLLQQTVENLPRDRFLVVYCGCCPWTKCPNIRAAYRQLVSMGFKHVKALYIETNFGADWVTKGYPVANGG